MTEGNQASSLETKVPGFTSHWKKVAPETNTSRKITNNLNDPQIFIC